MTRTLSRRARRPAELGLGAVGVERIIAIGNAVPRSTRGGRGGLRGPDGSARPYLAVKGIRDIASGLVLLAVLARGDRRTTGSTALAAATIPFGDMIVVLTRGGSPRVALGVHGATCLVNDRGRGAPASGTRPHLTP